MLTLWDLLEPRRKRRRKPVRVSAPPPAPTRRSPMRDRYDEVTRRMLREHAVRVRKWRSSMSGVAWQVTYADGTVSRLIEAPRPRGPMSAAVFLHEIGHHAIGLGAYTPRCLEEYHAWRFSLDTMRAEGLNVTPAVEKRMKESLEYAVYKALKRRLKRLPPELEPYLPQAQAWLAASAARAR
ncbi:MAG: hypothetical protein ACIARR_07860 [Phycisphaerales bacterium JB059]